MYYYIVTCVLTIVLGPYLMPLDQGCLGCTNAWLSGVLKINKTFVKELCLLKLFFVTDVLYNWISQFKISCTNV